MWLFVVAIAFIAISSGVTYYIDHLVKKENGTGLGNKANGELIAVLLLALWGALLLGRCDAIFHVR